MAADPVPEEYRHAPKDRMLHIGSGSQRLEGWVNIDVQDLPEVDLVRDVSQGLEPFRDARAIYAEHFLEHLPVGQALDFLVEAHRVLAENGHLRLSTPNLDWVWATHYALDAPPADKVRGCIALNRAFYGWRHRFLWNREMLSEALTAVGFGDLGWCRYGESELEIFRGIERHPVCGDSADLAHVLIVEAARNRKPGGRAIGELRARLESEFESHTRGT